MPAFLAGWIIAYLSGLFDRFKTNKTTKQLTKTVADQNTEIARLKTEIAALKNAASPATVVIENAPEEETTPTADARDGS